MPAAPRADEPANSDAAAFLREFDSAGYNGFFQDWRNRRYHNCLPICFLPDWTVDFHYDPPHSYISDALYVLMGRSGACLSELESVYP